MRFRFNVFDKFETNRYCGYLTHHLRVKFSKRQTLFYFAFDLDEILDDTNQDWGTSSQSRLLASLERGGYVYVFEMVTRDGDVVSPRDTITKQAKVICQTITKEPAENAKFRVALFRARARALVLHKSRPEARRFSYGRNKFFSSFSCKRTAREARPPYSRSVGGTFFAGGNDEFRLKRICTYRHNAKCVTHAHTHTRTRTECSGACVNTVLRVPTYLLLFRSFLSFFLSSFSLSLFLLLFLFVCHAAAEAESRQTQGRHSSWPRM